MIELKVTPQQIQEMHDTLHAILYGEVPELAKDMPEVVRKIMTAECAVLCWMLGHQQGEGFAEKMEVLGEVLDKLGYRPMRIQ